MVSSGECCFPGLVHTAQPCFSAELSGPVEVCFSDAATLALSFVPQPCCFYFLFSERVRAGGWGQNIMGRLALLSCGCRLDITFLQLHTIGYLCAQWLAEQSLSVRTASKALQLPFFPHPLVGSYFSLKGKFLSLKFFC